MLTSATGEETLTPNPNECNSTLTSETRGIYPHCYILMLMSGVTGYEFATCSVGSGAAVGGLVVEHWITDPQRGNGRCLPDYAASPNHACLRERHWGPRLSILCLLGDGWGRVGAPSLHAVGTHQLRPSELRRSPPTKEGIWNFSPEGRWWIRPVRASAASQKLNILAYSTLKGSSVLS